MASLPPASSMARRIRGPGRTARSWHRHPAKHFRRLPQDHRRLTW
jgi:hypothetical protein